MKNNYRVALDFELKVNETVVYPDEEWLEGEDDSILYIQEFLDAIKKHPDVVKAYFEGSVTEKYFQDFKEDFAYQTDLKDFSSLFLPVLEDISFNARDFLKRALFDDDDDSIPGEEKDEIMRLFLAQFVWGEKINFSVISGKV